MYAASLLRLSPPESLTKHIALGNLNLVLVRPNLAGNRHYRNTMTHLRRSSLHSGQVSLVAHTNTPGVLQALFFVYPFVSPLEMPSVSPKPNPCLICLIGNLLCLKSVAIKQPAWVKVNRPHKPAVSDSMRMPFDIQPCLIARMSTSRMATSWDTPPVLTLVAIWFTHACPPPPLAVRSSTAPSDSDRGRG